MRTFIGLALTLLVMLVVGMWYAGTFDHGLAQYGLNSRQCERNLFGTVYCGREIPEYQRRVRVLLRSR